MKTTARATRPGLRTPLPCKQPSDASRLFPVRTQAPPLPRIRMLGEPLRREDSPGISARLLGFPNPWTTRSSMQISLYTGHERDCSAAGVRGPCGGRHFSWWYKRSVEGEVAVPERVPLPFLAAIQG